MKTRFPFGLRILSLIFLSFILSFSLPGFGASKNEPVSFLVLGDSLTDGYGVSRDEAFPKRLEEKLHREGWKNAKVINAGLSGSTTASGLQRLKWFLKMKPEFLILALGSNDGLRGVSVDAMKSNLQEIIDHAQAKKIKVILAGFKMPKNYGEDYRKSFEGAFVELTKKNKLDFIPFLLEGVALVPDLNLEDGIHPNAKGHERIAENVFAVLREILEK